MRKRCHFISISCAFSDLSLRPFSHFSQLLARPETEIHLGFPRPRLCHYLCEWICGSDVPKKKHQTWVQDSTRDICFLGCMIWFFHLLPIQTHVQGGRSCVQFTVDIVHLNLYSTWSVSFLQVNFVFFILVLWILKRKLSSLNSEVSTIQNLK